eukprot:3490533-Prymnesium_polylepis.1
MLQHVKGGAAGRNGSARSVSGRCARSSARRGAALTHTRAARVASTTRRREVLSSSGRQQQNRRRSASGT